MKFVFQLCVFFLIFVNEINSQNFEIEDIKLINNLYINEEYDVIKSKLKSLGYNLKSTTPDYTIGKIGYCGQFTYSKKIHYHFASDYNTKGKDGLESDLSFKTEKYLNYKSCEVQINLIFNDGVPTPIAKSRDDKALYIYKGLLDYNSSLAIISTKEIPNENEDYKRGIKEVSLKNINDNYGEVNEGQSDFENFPSKELVYMEYTDLKLPMITPELKTYFFNTLKIKNTFNLPYSPIENIKEYLQKPARKAVSIPIIKSGNLHKIKVSIGGKKVDYFIDSGASEVAISKNMEKYLKDLGVIRESDYLESAVFTLANGESQLFRRVLLPSINIGAIKITEVNCYIVEDNTPLLLGKSLLDKFTSWEINNKTSSIEIVY